MEAYIEAFYFLQVLLFYCFDTPQLVVVEG